jgi:DNA primase catalytic core
MSTAITDWIKYELYPNLFNSIDTALPEFSFKRNSGGWGSSLKIDLTTPKERRADKTVVTKKAPGLLLEQGGETISLIDYTMRRDGVDFIKAVKSLADTVGLQLPKGEFIQENYQTYRDQVTLLEDCNSYFIYCLENSPGAEEVRAYLSARGYSGEDVKAMELGYIPSQDKLFKYLLGKGHSQSLIEGCLRLHTGIGSTHRLTIPYRSGGAVKGFKIRTTGEATPKYLNSTGLDRLGGFFNLSGLQGDKDVVIVEGELDSLSASAKGVENVVAIGGSSISSEQVRDAIKRGAKSFTICLDTEPGKQEETVRRINTAIGVILGEGVYRVYIVTLPDLGGPKTDPDRLIKEKGVEAFRDEIKTSFSWYSWGLNNVIAKYNSISETQGGLSDRERDSVNEEIVELGHKILDPIQRDEYKATAINYLRGWGVTEEGLAVALDRLRATREREAQGRAIKKLLSDATQLYTNGDITRALELLDSSVKEVKIAGVKDLIPPPIKFTTLLEDIATLPPAYKTGYNSLDTFIGFTPGAISLIAGRPSHGKTTLMFNLLLQMSSLYQRDSFYFFTYEEPIKNISIKLLNRLIDTDLNGHIREVRDLAKPTNYEFIKDYIRKGRTDIASVEEGKRKLQELIDSQRITLIDKNYSVEELSSLISYLNKRERIGALFIDYIQRMRTDKRTQDKRTEVAHISDQVLQIAKDSGLPIILGAQLNRDATKGGGEPKLENLKEAGNLEEDANTVISVYCKAREEEETENGEGTSKQREVELKIKTLKNREGEVNSVELLDWDRHTGRIKDRGGYSNTYFK